MVLVKHNLLVTDCKKWIHVLYTRFKPLYKNSSNSKNIYFLNDSLVATTMTFDLYFDVGGCHGYQKFGNI